jgi:hypothetical protein
MPSKTKKTLLSQKNLKKIESYKIPEIPPEPKKTRKKSKKTVSVPEIEIPKITKEISKEAFIFLIVLGVLLLLRGAWYLYERYDISNNVPRYTTSQSIVSKLKSGEFVTSKELKQVTGRATIAKNSDVYFVELSSDFRIESNTDIEVWLVKPQELESQDQLDKSDGYYLRLGKLVSNYGTQQYKLSEQEYGEFQYAVVLVNTKTGHKISQAIVF